VASRTNPCFYAISTDATIAIDELIALSHPRARERCQTAHCRSRQTRNGRDVGHFHFRALGRLGRDVIGRFMALHRLIAALPNWERVIS
jgi:hypothetical protein